MRAQLSNWETGLAHKYRVRRSDACNASLSNNAAQMKFERNNVKRTPQVAFPHARGKLCLSTRQAGIEIRAGRSPSISRKGADPNNAEGRPWLESVAVDGDVVSSYDYDANGNRTSVELNWSQLGYSTEFDESLDATDTQYNQADQLLTYGTKSYVWNNFGQLDSMVDSDPNHDGDTSDSETTSYVYDLFGNLLSVALPDGRTIEYGVDGAGRRVGRRELDADGNEISFKGWIYRDLLRPIAEVNDLGEVTARYIYSDGDGARQNGVDQLATRLGANQDTSLPFSGSNVPEAIELLNASGAVMQTLMLSTNQVGSVQLVTDAATGDVVQRIEYDEFGRVLADSAPGLQPFGFAGGLYDEVTKLVRFGARDYSAEVGRWVARDPVRFASHGSNLMIYGVGDPIRFLDPTGLDVDWECAWHSGKFVVQCSACVGLVAAAIADPELASKAALAGSATAQCLNCVLEFKKMDDKCNKKPKKPKGEPSCE